MPNNPHEDLCAGHRAQKILRTRVSSAAVAFATGFSATPDEPVNHFQFVGARHAVPPLSAEAIAAFNVSMAKAAACCFLEGRPPIASSKSLRVSRAASSIVLPFINSVKTDPHTSVGGQPYARKPAASMRPSLSRSERRIRSPHTGLVSSPVALASGSSPALRGFAM